MMIGCYPNVIFSIVPKLPKQKPGFLTQSFRPSLSWKMSSFTLERSDLLQIEPISSRGTLKLLPLGKKNKVHIYNILN